LHFPVFRQPSVQTDDLVACQFNACLSQSCLELVFCQTSNACLIYIDKGRANSLLSCNKSLSS